MTGLTKVSARKITQQIPAVLQQNRHSKYTTTRSANPAINLTLTDKYDNGVPYYGGS